MNLVADLIKPLKRLKNYSSIINPRLKSWVSAIYKNCETVSTVSLALILFFLFGNNNFGQTAHFDSLIHTGINQIYSLEFEQADSTFQILKKEFPKHPATKFFPAMTTWWKIMIDLDNEEYDDLFLEQIEETIDFCDDILDKNPNNIDAIFFKGGALGFRGRLESVREDWFDAAGDGKDALPLVYRAYALDSTNVDVQFGFGIYNYYADVIPEKYPFLKPIMLLFPDGDKEKGLKQLKNAAENGKYTKIESKYFLMTLYYKFEDDNKTALKYAEDLIKQFPYNPSFHRYYARLLRRVSQVTKAAEEFGVIYQRCADGVRGYNDKTRREASYYIADKYWQKAEFDKAIKYFKECSDLSYSFDQEDDGFNVVSLLQLGKIYDVLGEREKAKQYYEEVLDLGEYNNSHEKVERYLEKPFKR